MGITTYLNRLTKMFKQIGAYHYTKIEKTYGEKLWKSFIAVLENLIISILKLIFAIHTEMIEIVEE